MAFYFGKVATSINANGLALWKQESRSFLA
jgi:hypothetical protein